MNRIRCLPVWSVLVMLMISAASSLAQEASDIPQVTIEVMPDGYSMSDSIPEGAVAITIQNNTDEAADTNIWSLNEGIAYEDFLEAVSKVEDEGPLAYFQMASIKAWMVVMPGESVEAILDFAPGEHALGNEQHLETIQSFTVEDTEGEGANPPEVTVEVELVDFGFNVLPAIPAGPQLWHVQNLSQETPHELLIARLDDDLPVGAVNETLLGMRGMEGITEVPVIVRAAGPGEQFWVTYDLEPGTYALVCFLPDIFGSGMLYAHLGMHQIILVTESE